METKDLKDRQKDLGKNQGTSSQTSQTDMPDKSRIFNAGEITNKEAPTSGVDHTLTPGQNPVPPDDENKDVEWNKNEKVSDDKKMYANNDDNENEDTDDHEEE